MRRTRCWCGEKLVDKKCSKHLFTDKDYSLPQNRAKQKPFSGYSKWRQENGQFQALEGR